MERTELIRERHKPDWLPILLGITVNFAIMGVLAILGTALRMLRFMPSDSIATIVFKLLWLIGSVTVANYIAGFVTGIMMGTHSRIAAAINGLIVSQFTILLFYAVAFFGVPPLPGVVFSLQPGGEASEGLVWWAMMITLPAIFATMYGGMSGNNYVRREDPIEAGIDREYAAELELERKRKAA